MLKAYIYGVVVGLAFFIVIGVSGSRLQQKDAREKEYQAELVDATPVQIGMLTEKQRTHSRIYNYYGQVGNSKTMSELLEQSRGNSKFVGIILHVGMGPVLHPEAPEKYFGEMADASDAIIRGIVSKKVSQINEDDSFIFTDYDVVIKEVLKNNVTAQLETGMTVIVTRPGGKVVVDDVILKAIDQSFLPLPVSNNDILLFLQFVPETGTYKATRDTGSFEIKGSTLRPLTGGHYPPGVLGNEDSFLRNTDSFLQTVRAVSNQ